MKTVSVKQLRTELPKILKSLEQGQEYLLIYRSRPVGEIIPLRSAPRKKRKDFFDLLEEPIPGILREGETSVDLIREDRG